MKRFCHQTGACGDVAASSVLHKSEGSPQLRFCDGFQAEAPHNQLSIAFIFYYRGDLPGWCAIQRRCGNTRENLMMSSSAVEAVERIPAL